MGKNKWVSAKEQAAVAKLARAVREGKDPEAAAQALVNAQIRNANKRNK